MKIHLHAWYIFFLEFNSLLGFQSSYIQIKIMLVIATNILISLNK